MKELLEQLNDKKSSKRRSAAKKLRKLGDLSAGSYLLEALKKELKDVRTWETQYQMIMAIGECGYVEALPFIFKLSKKSFKATMIYTGIGDAIVRLSKKNDNDASSALKLFDTDNEQLINGGLRAIAVLRMRPSESEVNELVDFVSKFDINNNIRFWVIAAAAGWEGDKVHSFLKDCENSIQETTRLAVELAYKKKYKNWNPA